jgi:CspA family cold shock protein
MKGTIKFFKRDKGFGFIIGEDDKDYFVHISQIEKQQAPFSGDNVYFTPKETKRGLQARNITLIENEKQ